MSSGFFINRPLFAIVISVIIATLGIISLCKLPVEKYPDIAPPTINVWASYPGASAETVRKGVVAPLESAINGVDNMMYMTSSAGNGSASISISFKQGTNPDIAAINVQNRLAQAQSMLPAEVLKFGVSVEKQQPGQLRVLALESPGGTYDENFLCNYFYNYLRPGLLRIPGVGKVDVWGGQYAMRIWLKPDAMAHYGIVPSDISSLLEEQNVEASIGNIGENSNHVFQYVLRYSGRKMEVADFENLVVTSKVSGEELRLKDIADVELGQSDYSYANHINGNPGIMGSISQVSGSNATSVNLAIDALIEETKKSLPKDIRILTFDNTNDFLFAAIREVIHTLILAVFLVLAVVYLFVQDIRATLIPAIGIIVSLIGTFAFMIAAGYSINMLTLFALVLVIGTVVDDSIVVVEAVQARFDAGYKSSNEAATDAMRGITSALFTTTLVFMVIFIPVSCMGGTSGIFYQQFGLTMAVAVGLSLIGALTLSPALCALLLKPGNKNSSMSYRLHVAYHTVFNVLIARYRSVAEFFIRHKWVVFTLVIAAVSTTFYLMKKVPSGLVPDEDMGSLMVDISTPPGYTMKATEKVLTRVTGEIRKLPEVEAAGAVVGLGGSNKGMIYIQLSPWEARPGDHQSSRRVAGRIEEILSSESEAQSLVSSPGMIDGYGRSGGFEFSILNLNNKAISEFYDVSKRFVEKLNECPGITDAYSGYEINYPQYKVDVDVSRCKKFGIEPSAILNELTSFLGSTYISNLNLYNQVYQVSMQLRPDNRNTVSSLDKLFVRSSSGSMLPVSQFLTIEKEHMPQSIENFNMINSIGVSGSVGQGNSSGEAIRLIKELAEKELPVGYSVEFSGISREGNKAGNNTLIIFVLCLFFVYLIMVALYESLFIPLAVILSVPFGLAGAFILSYFLTVENNIYLQVGLIMLIGLLAKTAILLTEFATQCRESGMSMVRAASFAAKMRLRPVLMTSLTMIFGMIPLMVAHGAGANGSRTIGTGVVGGMTVGTIGLLLVVPALFVVFQKLQEKFKPIVFKKSSDPIINAELIKLNEEE